MAESDAMLGLMVRGQFGVIEDASFTGSEGKVLRSILKVHDPVGMEYISVSAMNDGVMRLESAFLGVKPGEPVAVRLRTTKTGGLTFVSRLA